MRERVRHVVGGFRVGAGANLFYRGVKRKRGIGWSARWDMKVLGWRFFVVLAGRCDDGFEEREGGVWRGE